MQKNERVQMYLHFFYNITSVAPNFSKVEPMRPDSKNLWN